MASAVDGIVLEFHDRSGSETGVVLQVSGKRRYGGHHHDDLVFRLIAMRLNDPLHDSCTDLILDRSLRIVGSRDEELILDVNEVLTVLDDADVGIGDGVLEYVSGCHMIGGDAKTVIPPEHFHGSTLYSFLQSDKTRRPP